MYIILGGTGNVGSAVAKALLKRGEKVTIVTRSADRSGYWERDGATVAEVDVLDTDRLRSVFKTGKRLFLLNPPGDIATDTSLEERRTADSIVQAVRDSGLEYIVAESTYGAQPGERLGDLNVLYEMEQSLVHTNTPFTVVRGAYYMSNWAAYLPSVKETGILPSFYPEDFSLPMVAPEDIGAVAAQLLTSPGGKGEVHHVEGPQYYTPGDVARAFAQTLGREVKVQLLPREEWIGFMTSGGFSEEAAKSMANMTAATLTQNYDASQNLHKGATTLEAYISRLGE